MGAGCSGEKGFESQRSSLHESEGVERSEQTSSKEKYSPTQKTCVVMRWMLRTLFGSEKYDKHGYFVDRQMAVMVHDYSDGHPYPSGDHSLRGHSTWILSVAVSSDGRHLYSGSSDGSILQWDLFSNRKVGETEVRKGRVFCLDFHSGMLVAGTEDPYISRFDEHLNNEQFREIYICGNGSVLDLRFDHSGQVLVSASLSGLIQVWSAQDGKPIRQFHCDSPVRCALFLSGEVISGSEDGWIKKWDGIKQESGEHLTRVESMSVDCRGCTMASGSENEVVIWDVTGVLSVREVLPCGVTALCFHPRCPSVMALAHRNRRPWIELRDVHNGSTLGENRGPTLAVTSLCFTPDGSKLISVSKDKRVRIWQVYSLLPIYKRRSRRMGLIE